MKSSRDDPKNYHDGWDTPPEWIEWVRQTLRETYFFDPCPSEWAPGDLDGLEIPWKELSYCNHPGSRGSAAKWWTKFVYEMCRFDRPAFIWCAYSIEQLRQLDPSPLQLSGWVVIPKKRIAYIDQRTGERGKSPAQASFFWSSVTPAEPPEECIITPTVFSMNIFDQMEEIARKAYRRES